MTARRCVWYNLPGGETDIMPCFDRGVPGSTPGRGTAVTDDDAGGPGVRYAVGGETPGGMSAGPFRDLSDALDEPAVAGACVWLLTGRADGDRVLYQADPATAAWKSVTRRTPLSPAAVDPG